MKEAGDANPLGAVGAEQKKVLDANGGATVSERAVQPYNAAAAAGRRSATARAPRRSCLDELRGKHEGGTDADRVNKAVAQVVLAQVRKKDGGHPTATEAGWMKTELAALGNVKGMDYGGRPRSDRRPGDPSQVPGGERRHRRRDPHRPRRVGCAAQAGRDGAAERRQPGGSHAMVVVDVRQGGRGPMYEVADPSSGITTWCLPRRFRVHQRVAQQVLWQRVELRVVPTTSRNDEVG